jgi:hypothetical protein
MHFYYKAWNIKTIELYFKVNLAMKRWKKKWGKYWGNLENSFLNHKIYLDKKGKRLWENYQIISLIIRFT